MTTTKTTYAVCKVARKVGRIKVYHFHLTGFEVDGICGRVEENYKGDRTYSHCGALSETDMDQWVASKMDDAIRLYQDSK